MIEITNSSDYVLDFGHLLEGAKQFRQSTDIKKLSKYGIDILDRYVGGILPNELVVIGAASGIGKSDLAYNIGITNALNKKVLLFPLEGDIYEMAYRYIQKEINKDKINVTTAEYRFNLNKDKVNELENNAIENMLGRIKENLFIYNKKEIASLAFIKQLIMKSHEAYDLIIIDHLHYISFDSQESEYAEIGKVMRELKQITDIIRKPIVLISHLRKKDQKDKNSLPTMYDLHGSSNIYKEATSILLLSKMEMDVMNQVPLDITEDRRYSATRITLAKSRIGIPECHFGLVYDRYKKQYTEYQELIKEDSVITELEEIKF